MREGGGVMRSAGLAAIAASFFSLMAHAAPPVVFDGERYEQRFLDAMLKAEWPSPFR
jgi:hypothetical protein